jgi:TPP-dependent trihydroxycyclohexane-1,2-dione (THcHDO) dehydratase
MSNELEALRAEVEDLRAKLAEEFASHAETLAMYRRRIEQHKECMAKLAEADKDAGRYLDTLDDLLSWFPEKPSHEWRIKAGEMGADADIANARKIIDAARGNP